MIPLLGKPLTDFVFVDQTDPDAVSKADDDLAADSDHAARRAGHRSRTNPVAGRIWHSAGHDNGAQPR